VTEASARLTAALADRYRVERELGAGGMATVYLAEDLKHDRKVAIKVLRPELAAVLGAERFVQEIKTTAQLQHPHILPLHDSGTADGFLFYVMPYIEGETLRDKLNRETHLGIEEAVRITTEVADALDYAHRSGVIHRDIKPENILLHDGRPMVADFGIALAVSAAAGGRMTETGMSLGTPHYMSPEQATADKDITARSDVYSLASVLYEMLAGQPPHLGGSAQQIIMKIIAEPVRPVRALRKNVPLHVGDALATALEKLPADRFATAREFAAALTSSTYSREPATAGAVAPGRPDWRTRAAVPALVAATFLLIALVASALRPKPTPMVGRFDVAWPGFAATPNIGVAVSRDGARLVTVRSALGRTSLALRRRDQLGDVELPGTDGAENPAFSPDGSRVVFMQPGTALHIVDLAGGPPTLLTDTLVGGPGVAWGSDSYVYYDGLGVRGLMRVPESGGTAEEISALDSSTGELQHVWPDPLPNGRGVIMVINRGGPGAGATEYDGIAVLDLETRRHRELFAGVYARYSPSGHLLFVTHDGKLMGVPFDQRRLEPTGTPVVLAEGLSVRPGMGAVDLAMTDDGTLWYTTGGRGEQELAWVTRDGTVTPFPHRVSTTINPRISVSPDGERLAYSAPSQGGSYIGVLDVARGTEDRLTFDQSFVYAAWNPDGKSLVLESTDLGLYTVAADGSSVPERVPGTTASRAVEPSWTGDGAGIVFTLLTGNQSDVAWIRPAVDSAPTVLVLSQADERLASTSPNGEWLLFVQSAGLFGNPGVFVRPFMNAMSSLRQVADAGVSPAWSHDGREIYYRRSAPTGPGSGLGERSGGEEQIVAVPVIDGSGFTTGTERVVLTQEGLLGYDVARDGRLAILRNRGGAAEPRLIMVEHFDVVLKEKFGR